MGAEPVALSPPIPLALPPGSAHSSPICSLLDIWDSLPPGSIPPGVSQATLYDAAYISHAQVGPQGTTPRSSTLAAAPRLASPARLLPCLLQAIGNGAIWEQWFTPGMLPRGQVTSNFGMLTHGVNVAQVGTMPPP